MADDAALGPSLIGGRVEQENPPPRAEIENVQVSEARGGQEAGPAPGRLLSLPGPAVASIGFCLLLESINPPSGLSA